MGTSMLLIQSLNMIINNFEEEDSEVADFQNIINRIREAISMVVDINFISKKEDWFSHSEKAFETLDSCLRKIKIVIDLIAEYTEKKVDGELEYDDLYFDELRENMTDYSNEFDILNRVKISVQDDISKFIFEPTENDGVKFSLGDISALYNRYFNDFETVIFMTATPSITHFLELGVEGALKLQMKSNFSTKTAPVILLRDKMVDMSYNKRDMNFNKLFVNIMFLVDKHGTHNGLIHTGSYLFQSRFEKYTESVGKSRTFIFCKNTSDIERGMKFLSDNPNSGKVLVSPSILEGVDAKGETAQYQIAMKCPYPNSKDRHIEQIMLKNRVQYNSLVRINIEQMIGRVQRSPFDIGYTYLLDSKFDSFIYRNKLSKHVMDKVIKINSALIEKVWEKAENVHK
jgi:Rad3-related DNA helicase